MYRTISKSGIINNLTSLIFISALFQNLFATLLVNISELGATFILIFKEVLLLILCMLCIFWGRSTNIKILLPLSLCFAVLIHYIFSGVLLQSLRQVLMVPFVILAGALSAEYLNREKLDLFLNRIFIIVAGLAIIEYSLASQSEWFLRGIGYDKFLMSVKGADKWMINSGVLGSFYSWDFYSYLGISIRRLAGLNYIDPVVFGQFLAFPATYYMVNKKYFLMSVFIVLISLCISKGGMLAFLIACYLHLADSFFARLSVFFKALSLGAIILIISIIDISALNVQSIINHLQGLYSGIAVFLSNPFGIGIGMAGNYAGLYLGNTGVGESFLGTLLAQIGILGVFLYLLMISITIRIKSIDPFWLSIKYASIALIICSVLSESAITFSATALVLFIAATYKQERIQ